MGLCVTLLVAVAGLLVIASGCGSASEEQPAAPLKIGLLLDFTGSPEASADRKRAFDLAIRHVNEGGGVLGMPVEGIAADATRDPSVAVEAARRLVEVEGVHAIVGPNASAASLQVSQSVSGTFHIPTISPSATSPQLTGADDGGYFFRTALSDAAQGPVLAQVTRERGFDNVGLVYQDDAYGQGLAEAFEESWDGMLRVVPVDMTQTSYHSELTRSADAGAQALVVIAFEDQAISIVREAIDEGIYSLFVFGDAAKRVSLVREIGGEGLGGMYGTAGCVRSRQRRDRRVGSRLRSRVRRAARPRLREGDLRCDGGPRAGSPGRGQRRRCRHPRPPAGDRRAARRYRPGHSRRGRGWSIAARRGP